MKCTINASNAIGYCILLNLYADILYSELLVAP